MTLVINQLGQASQGPHMHALVIGVGAYTNAGWGVEPLDSAGRSALAMAQALVGTFGANPQWQLGTLDLLVSVPGTTATFDAQVVEAPTIDNVLAAIQRWFVRCSASEDDLAIFYFAGHGVEKGLTASLLLQEFGRNALNIGDDALNLGDFSLGMDNCKARQQLFISDACRTTPPQLTNLLAPLGRAGVAPTSGHQAFIKDRDHLVLKSTAPTRASYGADGQPSRFTRALIKALEGAAWEDTRQPWTRWTLSSERLHIAVNHLLGMEEKHMMLSPQRAYVGGNFAGFVLRESQSPPRVPVYIRCAPPRSTYDAAFTVRASGGHTAQRAAGFDETWELALDASQTPYQLQAAIAAAPVAEKFFVVRPPSTESEVVVP